MDEVIAYIKEQDQIIKNLRTNETVREELIVEMKSEMAGLKGQIERERYEHTKTLNNHEDKTYLEIIVPLEKENEKLTKEIESLK